MTALVAGVLGLAACRGAHADHQASSVLPAEEPSHGIDVPADWKELPDVGSAAVAAAREILGEDADVHAHAWGETSRGCYLAIVEAHGARKDRLVDVADQLQAALGDAIEVKDWTTSPDAEDRSEIGARFTSADATGLLRAHLVLDGSKLPHAVAAACFYNDRQPAVCESACAPLLAMLAALEVSP
jgi:hypothetical protein